MLGFSTCPSCSCPCARLVLFLGLCACFPFAAAESCPYSSLTAQLQGSLCILPEGLDMRFGRPHCSVLLLLVPLPLCGLSDVRYVLAQVGSLSKQLSSLH